jgi:hypothetical protein
MHESIYPSRLARTNRLATALLALCLLGIAVATAAYGLIVLGSAAKEILVSVITASTALLSAVFAYAFQRAKDIELASIQKQRELEIAAKKTKQDNYARILERLAPYIRDPMKAGDDFTTAQLHAWVTGSADVLLAVEAFRQKRNWMTLDHLLAAMRRDLSLGDHRDLNNLSSQGMFPAPAPPPGVGTL